MVSHVISKPCNRQANSEFISIQDNNLNCHGFLFVKQFEIIIRAKHSTLNLIQYYNLYIFRLPQPTDSPEKANTNIRYSEKSLPVGSKTIKSLHNSRTTINSRPPFYTSQKSFQLISIYKFKQQMDMSQFDKYKQDLHRKDFNPKTFCDWSNGEQVENLMIDFGEIQISLQSQISQSIESHLLGKLKALAVLKQSIPVLEKEKLRENKANPELSNILQIINVKAKIEYCLAKLEPMINQSAN